ncbi:MAG: pyridoxal-phosphate-dependent aminotransferase family protein [Halobacteriales archaeon]
MDAETLLLNPGPVMMRPEVQRALSAPMVSHRSAAFEAVFDEVREGFRHLYTHSRADGRPSNWDGEVVFLNATATLGMEASIANFVGPDDAVLVLINGNFGVRFAQIAERHAGVVDTLEIPWGESFDVAAVTEAVEDGGYDLVTAVHTETSSGLRNPIGEIGAAVAETDALFVVDGVSAIGGERVHPAEWGIDVSVVDAQKAVAASPGVCTMFLSSDALEALSEEQTAFYHDLHRTVERAGRSQTPFTSAVTLFFGLQAALDGIMEIGVDAWLDAHAERARAWERTARAMGLELFASPAGPSDFANTVTAIELPEPVKADYETFTAELRDRDVFVGGGHGHLAGEIFRLGTMGDLTPARMARGVDAVGAALSAAGADVDVAAGREALAGALNAPIG